METTEFEFTGNKSPILEDSLSYSHLITIKTGKAKRKETKKILRASLVDRWKGTPKIQELLDEPVDLSIALYVSKKNIASQDLDNISKVVLDALSKTNIGKEKDTGPYILNNDSQVMRLLLSKTITEASDGSTCSMVISIRKHDPDKQIIINEELATTIKVSAVSKHTQK